MNHQLKQLICLNIWTHIFSNLSKMVVLIEKKLVAIKNCWMKKVLFIRCKIKHFDSILRCTVSVTIYSTIQMKKRNQCPQTCISEFAFIRSRRETFFYYFCSEFKYLQNSFLFLGQQRKWGFCMRQRSRYQNICLPNIIMPFVLWYTILRVRFSRT